jgi:hypothetical protein
MDTLPNELLLKIFGKVDWYYQIENPLNLICKRWNNLIKKHGIDFDTDYNTELIIELNTYNPLRKDWRFCEVRLYENKIFITGSKNYDKNRLEKLLLKIPAYYLKIIGNVFYYTSKVISFHNRHIKKLKLIHIFDDLKKYLKRLTAFSYLTVNFSSVSIKPLYNNKPVKEIEFKSERINDPYIFDFLKYSTTLMKIKFIDCKFSWNGKTKLSDRLSILSKKYKNGFTIYFEDCKFKKEEFHLNEKHYISGYLISNLLFTLDNGIWVPSFRN